MNVSYAGFVDTGYYWLNGYTVDQREADAYAVTQALSQDQFMEMLDSVWSQVRLKWFFS